MLRMRTIIQSTIVATALAFAGHHAFADLAFETETARVIEQGKWQFSSAFEYQFGKSGKEFAYPIAIEYGLFKDFEVLFEPVPYVSVHPKGEKSIGGLGDTELTLNYLAVHEQSVLPAIAFAGEVKFPTARKLQLGSGELDYRLFAAASKRIGAVDLHANIGYNIIGSPPGVNTRNPLDLALAAEWFVNKDFDLYAEITYQGSSLGSNNGTGSGEAADAPLPSKNKGAKSAKTSTESSLTPEVGGKTIVGTAGVRYHVSEDVDVFGSFSFDNSDDKLVRVGMSVKF